MTAYFSNAKTYCYGKAKGRLNTRDLTSRDWTTRHHIARVDIARLISVFVLMIRKNNIMFERQVPTEKKTCRRRPSNIWYDDDCRTAKRNLRAYERAATRVGPLSDTSIPAVQTWCKEQRQYVSILRQK